MIIIIGWIIVFCGLYLIITLSDLLFLLIKYRAYTDNWEYPIDPMKFAEFCKGEEQKEKEHEQNWKNSRVDKAAQKSFKVFIYVDKVVHMRGRLYLTLERRANSGDGNKRSGRDRRACDRGGYDTNSL